MAMNISPDGTPRRAPFGRELNDLNSPGSFVSIEDNTVDPVCHTNQKWRNKRRFTLSLIEKDLEDARKVVASKIEQKVFGDNTGAINKEFKEKNKVDNDTGTWRNIDVDSEELNKDAKHKEQQVYAKYVQEGDRNLMLIYEAKDTKSGMYVKQLGNKNVVVHLNVSSNLCQLIDPINKGIIPLDSEGEVWLEIKRRSQVFPEKSDPSDAFSSSDNNSVSGESMAKGRRQQTSDGCRKQACEHTDSVYESHINIQRRAVEHTESCDEHTESLETENDSMDGEDSIYFIKRKNDSLNIKFSRWSQSSALNMNKLQDSPILSHRKVIEFLTDRGNNFDVNICDWEYEKESVYSYISDEQIELMELEDGYSKVIETAKDSPVQQAEENYTLYARPNKQPPRKTHHPERTESLETVSTSAPNKSPGIPNRQPTRTTHHPARTGSLEAVSTSAPNKSPAIPIRSISNDPDSDSEKLSAPPVPVRTVTSINRNLPRNPISSNPISYISEPDINNEGARNSDSAQEISTGITASIDFRLRTTWDHGDIDKSEAKRRLNGKPHGSFLLRAATGLEPNHVYTIELLDEGQFKKLMIMKTQSQYHFNEFRKQKFDSIEKLIETILKSGVEVKDTKTGNWKTISVKPVPP